MEPVRRITLEQLALKEGESVLDVGCGIGSLLRDLHSAVGRSGRVVGVDDSTGMLRRAQQRVAAGGWTNVELRRADASSAPLGASEFDAAVAHASLSAMPDVPAATRHVYDALRPGGRLFVFDLRLVPAEDSKVLTRLLGGIYAVLAGATCADVRAELHHAFDEVDELPIDRPTIEIALTRKAETSATGR